MRHLGGVVASVEDEQRRRSIRREPADESGDLVHCRRVGVLPGMDALDVERGGPAIPGEGELSQPLVRPASDDRLSSRVARGMVVVAALRTGFGVAAGPDTQVDGVDRMPRAARVASVSAQGRHVEVPLGQGVVEAAPAAAVCGLQAKCGSEVTESAASKASPSSKRASARRSKAGMQGSAKGAEGREVMSGHGAQLARTASGRPAPSIASPPRVKSQAKPHCGRLTERRARWVASRPRRLSNEVPGRCSTGWVAAEMESIAS